MCGRAARRARVLLRARAPRSQRQIAPHTRPCPPPRGIGKENAT